LRWLALAAALAFAVYFGVFFGVRPGLALPYAAGGRSPRLASAAVDARAVADARGAA
jgi:hypothetical protein